MRDRGGIFFGGGEDLTYGDLAVFQALHAFTDPEDPFYTTLPGVGSRMDSINHYPVLKEHFERVGQVPGIRKWLESRPRGLF